ncbi:Abscisic acid receptor PYL6 [Raphanus sativus]|uniref:Abscisic acid receptor PYL6-like n=1 Tax=Raphanus sativus TaxID=3726 RepID=A0A6J0LF77_RAPSA|nr:abscisic acid receptor PYL6-like [Raphanus sativus]KAJ4892047.1 Abscisic acid receptor PYL6 [Raphanus sativus]
MPTSLQFQRSSSAAETANTTISTYHHNHHKQVQKVSLTRGMADVPDHVEIFHTHVVGSSQCFSVVVQDVDASASAVWSILSRFEHPQAYKHFVRSCHVAVGDGREVGSVREIRVVSGLPASFSLERLEIMDDDRHVISFSVVGGDHRLQNYRSVTTVHECSSSENDSKRARVVESYVVDVPAGNDKEETCSFADTIVRCNLQSLAKLAENLPKLS